MANPKENTFPFRSVFLGIGGNVIAPGFDSVHQTLEAVIAEMESPQIQIYQQSSWYQSTAVPVSDQPDFLNAVLHLHTSLSAENLLASLLSKELEFGRKRSVPNAARTVDLDILSFETMVCSTTALDLPHPRMEGRKFVIYPLAEIAPQWVHPILNKTASELALLLNAAEFDDQQCVQLGGE